MKTYLLIATLALVLATPAMAKHHKLKKEPGEPVNWRTVPPAVQTTIQTNAAGGKVTEVRKEVKNGTNVYRAQVKEADGKMVHVAVNEAGKLMKVKVEEKKKHHFSFGI